MDLKLDLRSGLAAALKTRDAQRLAATHTLAIAAEKRASASMLRVKKLTADATLPARANAGDAGFDLSASESFTILPGARALVGTGLAIALPAGTVGLVCPRSGLAVRHGITVLNAPGIVDAGYRGEWKVALINLGEDSFRIAPGDRIAQLVITSYLAPAIEVVEELDETDRGLGGFGSTGR